MLSVNHALTLIKRVSKRVIQSKDILPYLHAGRFQHLVHISKAQNMSPVMRPTTAEIPVSFSCKTGKGGARNVRCNYR